MADDYKKEIYRFIRFLAPIAIAVPIAFLIVNIIKTDWERNSKELTSVFENSNSTKIEFRWPMTPPQIEVMSDWTGIINGKNNFGENIRYVKIDGRLAIQINTYDFKSFIFVPEGERPIKLPQN